MSATSLRPLIATALLAGMLPLLASAQGLPPPSRTMYKCKVNGTTTYSDAPCLGATRLEVEPTRGVSALSGRERIGQDIALERHREALAQAWRPITGMDAKEYAVFARRAQLAPVVRLECRNLDQSMLEAERDEQGAARAQLREVQERLLLLRRRFRELRC